jgi:hypothetical protein
MAVQPFEAVQLTLPPFSDARTYRVRPFPSTSTVPTPGTIAALTVTEALDAADAPVGMEEALAAAGAAVVGDPVDDALLDELQAAKKIETPATAPMVKARGRLWFER